MQILTKVTTDDQKANFEIDFNPLSVSPSQIFLFSPSMFTWLRAKTTFFIPLCSTTSEISVFSLSIFPTRQLRKLFCVNDSYIKDSLMNIRKTNIFQKMLFNFTWQ